jgi:hypothetical protein
MVGGALARERRRYMDDQIVSVRFTNLGDARRALHELKRLDRDGTLRVRGAALMERSGGGIGVPEGAQDPEGDVVQQGGIVGLLAESFANGPAGTLYGQPTEVFHGHGGPSPHEGERELALEEISRGLEPGVTLVIAEIADPDPSVLDSTLDALGGTATRRDAHDVYAEVQAADKAASAEEAQRMLRGQRREERKAKWERFKEAAKGGPP